MTKREFRRFDIPLFLAVVLLGVIGIILIASATAVNKHGLSRDFIYQMVWFGTGIIIMLAAAFINYQFIVKFFAPIYILSIVLLVGVLVQKAIKGKTVWREIQIDVLGFGIMPSEFAKLFMIIVLAYVISRYADKLNKFWFLCIILAIVAIPFGLIAMQPSLSAASVLLVILAAMLFIGKISYKWVILCVVVIIPLLLFLYYDMNSENPILVDEIFFGYQADRLLSFLKPEAVDPDKKYQIEQALTAIRAGGLWGQGLFNNNVIVPESANDFIFSILAAEFGFAGCLFVLAVVGFVIARCLLIAFRSEDFCGRLIAGSVGVLFLFQVFVNVGVNTALLPLTGMAFPFLSSGGSTMWINMALVGLAINVGMTRPKAMFEHE